MSPPMMIQEKNPSASMWCLQVIGGATRLWTRLPPSLAPFGRLRAEEAPLRIRTQDETLPSTVRTPGVGSVHDAEPGQRDVVPLFEVVLFDRISM